MLEEVNYKSHDGIAKSQERNIYYEENHEVKAVSMLSGPHIKR